MSILTSDDVRAVLGPVEDELVAEIIATGASRDELMEAHAWLTNDEAPMNTGRPLASGRVGRLIDILDAAEEASPDVPAA